VNPLEERLREAYRAAADTVRPETVLPGGVRGLHRDGHPAARPGRRGRSRSPLLAPLAAAAAVTVAVGTVYVLGSQLFAARPSQPPAAPTLYIYFYNGSHEGTITPVNTATNSPGKPIHVSVPGPTTHLGQLGGPLQDYFAPFPAGQIVITPDGKTAYLTTGSTVTPVSTATGTPGKPIYLGGHPVNYPDEIAVTPDGKTVYVTAESGCVVPATAHFSNWATAYAHCAITVTPISTATNTPGKTVHVGLGGTTSGALAYPPGQIVITPDGKTAYVSTRSGVTPISTATNTAGKTIPPGMKIPSDLGFAGENIAVTPDGKTVYVAFGYDVVPISTATGRPGKPIPVGPSEFLSSGQIAITPDGKTAYFVNYNDSVTPISTATGTPGKPIPVGGSPRFGDIHRRNPVGQIAITPDGKTAYVAFGSDVTPINTATGIPGKTIHVGGQAGPEGRHAAMVLNGALGTQIVMTPDGKTVYLIAGSGVTPISTVTNTPGKTIHVGGRVFQAFAITP
jgi:DNA-binding beta-propeller fold protein YncE